MSYVKTLKNGEINAKKAKNNKLTPYDKFMAKRKATTLPYRKNMVLFSPQNLTEARLIIDAVKNKKGAIFNVANRDAVLKQRLLDFLSGAEYSLGFSIKKIDVDKYLVLPSGVQFLTSDDLTSNC
ncbi:MAG: cell division protein SepF [Clostridia bacterium]|nr:cell division protein SepF [Clostridia bacterium]